MEHIFYGGRHFSRWTLQCGYRVRGDTRIGAVFKRQWGMQRDRWIHRPQIVGDRQFLLFPVQQIIPEDLGGFLLVSTYTFGIQNALRLFTPERAFGREDKHKWIAQG